MVCVGGVFTRVRVRAPVPDAMHAVLQGPAVRAALAGMDPPEGVQDRVCVPHV